jgi:hypothetical protein
VLGTALLLGVLVCGFLNVTPWILAPATVMAAVIGVHFPPGKAQMARERGIYWNVLLTSLPLQFVFMLVLYGIGWGASMLID